MIVTRSDVRYAQAIASGIFDDQPALTKPIYGVPRKSRCSSGGALPRYLGIDREPLFAFSLEAARMSTEGGIPLEATEASDLFCEIEDATGREDGWVTDRRDILKLLHALGDARTKYEVVFAKEYEDSAQPPSDAAFLGCDAAYFITDHLSAICEALFYPRWTRTDVEGKLFRKYFDRLNGNGLFDTNEAARDYLQYYLSFDWTEPSDSSFTSIEVYSVDLSGDVKDD